MNGNRGAKGSIKDRLISMLYRLRYNDIKEKQFELEEKKKQRNYIENLKKFKEEENIHILDSRDKNILRGVKLVGFFDLSKKEIPIKITSNRKKAPKHFRVSEEMSYDDLKLNGNEMGIIEISSITKKGIDFKNEEKKTEDEIVILDEVRKFINKAKQEVSEISKEIDYIKEKSKDEKEDNKELEERYKKLREKIDKLKAKFDSIKYKYDLSEFKILESIKLAASIDDYKNRAKLAETEMLIKVCQKELDKVSGIEVVYKETKKVGSNIDEVNKKQKDVKIKFKYDKEKVNELANIEAKLKEEIEIQKKLVDEMYSDASRITKEERYEKVYETSEGFLSSLLRIAGGIITLPLSGLSLFGVTLGATLINKGIKGLNKSIIYKEKLEVDYSYEDLTEKLSKVENKLEYLNLTLADTLIEISKLKENITSTFLKYKKVIPEYDATLGKVLKLEEKIINQQEKMKGTLEKVEEEKRLNKEKVFRIKEMKNNDNK